MLPPYFVCRASQIARTVLALINAASKHGLHVTVPEQSPTVQPVKSPTISHSEGRVSTKSSGHCGEAGAGAKKGWGTTTIGTNTTVVSVTESFLKVGDYAETPSDIQSVGRISHHDKGDDQGRTNGGEDDAGRKSRRPSDNGTVGRRVGKVLDRKVGNTRPESVVLAPSTECVPSPQRKVDGAKATSANNQANLEQGHAFFEVGSSDISYVGGSAVPNLPAQNIKKSSALVDETKQEETVVPQSVSPGKEEVLPPKPRMAQVSFIVLQ